MKCDKCPFLSPKESDQTENKEPHWCSVLKRTLKHEGMHPSIPTPKDCPKEKRQ